MKTSENGKNLIKKYEGLRLSLYKDSAGTSTIGYGHTGKGLPKTISEAKANEYLDEDIKNAEAKVKKYKYDYTQNQFDALVSFAFNIGNIDQLTANGTRTLSDVGEKMLLYIYAGGVVSQGLKNRRESENRLFNLDDETSDNKIKKYNYKNAYNLPLSVNFQVQEFIARNSPLRSMYDSGRYTHLLIDDDLVKYLQLIRTHYKKPVIITSGYRPDDYNKSINGATSSLHIEGRASDIKIDGVTPKNLATYCKSLGIKGVGTYPSFVHIDTRATKYYWEG